MTDFRLMALIALLAPLTAACADSPSSGPSAVAVRDSAGIRIVENTIPAADSTNACRLSAEPLLDVGVATGSPAHELHRAFDGLRLPDGRIAIVNQGSREIRVFGPGGEHLRTFGREGDGPGEFQSPFRIWHLEPDTLIVFDSRNQRFSWFDEAGVFVRSTTFDPPYMNAPDIVAVGADILVAHHDFAVPEVGFEDQELFVILHDARGILLDTLGVFPYGQLGQAGPPELFFVSGPVFQARTTVGSDARTVYVGRGDEREVEVLTAAGALVSLIRWTGGSREVTEADVEERALSIRESMADSRRPELADAILDPDIPIADRFPALSNIFVDRAGHVWLEKYRRPGRDGPDRLIVFDPEGEFVCHGTIPDEMRLFEIGEDYVLGMEQDDLDIEHVRLYGLERPD